MENNNDRFFSEIGTETVPIFTNVENGAGIFKSGNLYIFKCFHNIRV